MCLNIFSFQRAFTARQKMALAAGNCDNPTAALEAKDILDSLYLGLECDVTNCDEFCDASTMVDEFVAHCPILLQELSAAENQQVTIPLCNNSGLSLNEKNGNLHLQMNNEQVTLPNLTIQRVYQNLLQDIHNNPDLYGTCLSSYADHLERTQTNSNLAIPVY